MEKKFRAWLPAIKKMTYSHTLDELINWNTKPEDNGTAIWLQWTGLKDKNDIEIYEGDYVNINHDILETFSEGNLEGNNLYVWQEIVDSVDVNGVVSFDKGFFSVEEWQLNWFEKHEIEIVGNIYENPEVLSNEI